MKKKFAARTMNVLSVPNWTVNFSSFHIDIGLRKKKKKNEREREEESGVGGGWRMELQDGTSWFHCMLSGKSSPFLFLDQWWYHFGMF